MHTELILIRGLPGSGKTTLAKEMALSSSIGLKHIETDMFFENHLGEYKFEGKKLSQAHQWCQTETKKWLRKGRSVVVSNTFVQLWEMQPYLNMAKAMGIRLTVLVCTEEYGSVHNIPIETINKMKENWQAADAVSQL